MKKRPLAKPRFVVRSRLPADAQNIACGGCSVRCFDLLCFRVVGPRFSSGGDTAGMARVQLGTAVFFHGSPGKPTKDKVI